MRCLDLVRLAVVAIAAVTAAASGHHHDCDRETLPAPPTPEKKRPVLEGQARQMRLGSVELPGVVAVSYRVRSRSASVVFVGDHNVTASFGVHIAEPLSDAQVIDLLNTQSLSVYDRRVLERRLRPRVPDSLGPHKTTAGVLLFAVPDSVRDADAVLRVFWLDGLTRDSGLTSIPIIALPAAERREHVDHEEPPDRVSVIEDLEDLEDLEDIEQDEDDDDGGPDRRWGAAVSIGMSKIVHNDDLTDDGAPGFAVTIDGTISLSSWLHTEFGLGFSGEQATAAADAPMELAMLGDLELDGFELWSALRAQAHKGDMHPYASVGTAFVNTTLRAGGRKMSDQTATGVGARLGLDIDLTARLAFTVSYGFLWLTPVDFNVADDIDVSRSTFLFGLRASTGGR